MHNIYIRYFSYKKKPPGYSRRQVLTKQSLLLYYLLFDSEPRESLLDSLRELDSTLGEAERGALTLCCLGELTLCCLAAGADR